MKNITLKNFINEWEKHGQLKGIHCETQNDYDLVLEKLIELNSKFSELKGFWNLYKEDTFIFNNNMYGSIDYVIKNRSKIKIYKIKEN